MTAEMINDKTAKDPWLSIIVPIYNAEKYLHKCLETIDGQTFSDYEVIMVDDGSADNSSEICKKYSKKTEDLNISEMKTAVCFTQGYPEWKKRRESISLFVTQMIIT